MTYKEMIANVCAIREACDKVILKDAIGSDEGILDDIDEIINNTAVLYDFDDDDLPNGDDFDINDGDDDEDDEYDEDIATLYEGIDILTKRLNDLEEHVNIFGYLTTKHVNELDEHVNRIGKLTGVDR